MYLIGLVSPIVIGGIWLYLARKKRASLYLLFPLNRKRLVYVAMLLVLFSVMFIPSKRNVEQTTSSGLNMDIYIVVDVSLSMHADDSKNNATRLHTAKEYFNNSLGELNGARFTVIEFSDLATVTQPGLYDTYLTKNTLDQAQSPLMYDTSGSKFSDPMRLVIERIDRTKQTKNLEKMERVAIFISDGEQIGEDKELPNFTKNLSKKIDKALFVGVGTEKGGHMKVTTNHLGGPNFDKDVKKYVVTTDELAEPNAPRDSSQWNAPLATSKANPNFMLKLSKEFNGKFINLETASNKDLSNELNKLKDGSSRNMNHKNKFSETSINGFYWIVSPACIVLILLIYRPLIGINMKRQKEPRNVKKK